MRLRDDTRGAAIQIGAVLLFAVLIIALSGYQATVVPEQNRADEFDHSKQVQGDLQDVRNAILSTAGTGTPQSASVRLGTEFQNRLFFLNPPDPAGTLTVEAGESLTIENAVGSDTNGYWNGSAREYDTASVSYEPGYREYRNAPSTHHEHSLVYNTHDDTTVAAGGQRLVAGETLSITEVTGEKRTSHSGAESLDIVPRSAGGRTVQVVAGDEPIRLTIPTDAPGLWAERLSSEPHVTDVEQGDGSVAVELQAEDGSEAIVYELRAAAVGIDTGETRPDAAYLVREGPENTTIGQPTGVEVRDRYDTPVAGETVSVYRDGDPVDGIRAGRDGVAYAYPEEPGEYELRIGEESYERVSFTVDRWVSGDPPDESPTRLDYRVDDLSNADTDRGQFVASFDAGDADRVEATFEHESGWASETITHGGPRGHVRYDRGGVYSDGFQLTLRAFTTDEGGDEQVATTESIPITADTENPASNGVLRNASDPAFEEVEVTDRSQWVVRYDVDHRLDTDEFDGRVEAIATSTGDGGYASETSSEPVDSQRLQTYGVSEEFAVSVLLYDSDEAVIDARIVRDVADGESEISSIVESTVDRPI